MKYLIVGRSGRGKDKLCSKLEKHGLHILKSYTTRPKRTPNEDTHIFITPEEAANITDKVATTVINGYEYFATATQVNECDVYVIDVNGVHELVKNMPDTSFHIVYCSTCDEETCKEMAIKRATDPEKETAIFEARLADEDAQFTEFEELLQNQDLVIAPNCICIHQYINDYQEETATNYATALVKYKHVFDNLLSIIHQCVTYGIVTSSKPDYIDVAYCGKTEPKATSYDRFADMLLSDQEGFYKVMTEWLCDVDISNIVK